MSDLTQIIELFAVLVIVVSIWAIVYFGSRIYASWRIRRDLGDMPTGEEIRELYAKNNAVIEYRDHSPTESKFRS